ncbi:MAG: hypothetical protein BWZ10_01241 [candidate division BRC1 bacterium ADurb.BinA364]|nr:MAG: hypothetical protein BWZ10_01241 [candidate division BRC1 bacterium ADurb.BinA364]
MTGGAQSSRAEACAVRGAPPPPSASSYVARMAMSVPGKVCRIPSSGIGVPAAAGMIPAKTPRPTIVSRKGTVSTSPAGVAKTTAANCAPARSRSLASARMVWPQRYAFAPNATAPRLDAQASNGRLKSCTAPDVVAVLEGTEAAAPKPRLANAVQSSQRFSPWLAARSACRIASRASRKVGSPGDSFMPSTTSRIARSLPAKPCFRISAVRHSHSAEHQISPRRWT